VASADGSTLYVGVGSNSNITENGMEAEKNRAAILQVDRVTGRWRLYATGLRNPNGLSFEPQGDALWTVVNERDELGPDLVPDYLTSAKRRWLLWLAAVRSVWPSTTLAPFLSLMMSATQFGASHRRGPDLRRRCPPSCFHGTKAASFA
jgi:hypothetical protein